MYLVQPRFNQLFIFQCSKLLADISVIQFYPSKFVLVTDILDTFGRVFFIQLISCRSNTTFCKPKPWLIAVRKFWMFLLQENLCMKEYSANLASLRQAVTYLPCFQVRRLLAIIGCKNWKVLITTDMSKYTIFFGGRGRRIKKVTQKETTTCKLDFTCTVTNLYLMESSI